MRQSSVNAYLSILNRYKFTVFASPDRASKQLRSGSDRELLSVWSAFSCGCFPYFAIGILMSTIYFYVTDKPWNCLYMGNPWDVLKFGRLSLDSALGFPMYWINFKVYLYVYTPVAESRVCMYSVNADATPWPKDRHIDNCIYFFFSINIVFLFEFSFYSQSVLGSLLWHTSLIHTLPQ